VGLNQSEVNIRAQSVQGNFPLNLFLGTRNFRAAQATAKQHTNTLRVRTHGLLNRLFHRAAERNALLQLLRNAATNQIGIQFRRANLNDVQTHALLGHGFQLSAQFINFRAAAANHNAWFSGVNRHRDLVCGRALNLDTRNCRISKFLVNHIA
jgi:hypothetical protein